MELSVVLQGLVNIPPPHERKGWCNVPACNGVISPHTLYCYCYISSTIKELYPGLRQIFLKKKKWCLWKGPDFSTSERFSRVSRERISPALTKLHTHHPDFTGQTYITLATYWSNFRNMIQIFPACALDIVSVTTYLSHLSSEDEKNIFKWKTNQFPNPSSFLSATHAPLEQVFHRPKNEETWFSFTLKHPCTSLVLENGPSNPIVTFKVGLQTPFHDKHGINCS